MDTKIEAKARELIKSGANKAKVKGFLLFEGLSEAEANKALKQLGLIRAMGEFRDELYDRLAKSNLGEAEFKAMIAKATDNAKKHESHYDGIRKLANAIRDSLKVAKAA